MFLACSLAQGIAVDNESQLFNNRSCDKKRLCVNCREDSDRMTQNFYNSYNRLQHVVPIECRSASSIKQKFDTFERAPKNFNTENGKHIVQS